MTAAEEITNKPDQKNAVPKTSRRTRRNWLPAGVCLILLGLTLIFGAEHFFSNPWLGNTRGKDEKLRPIPATALSRREVLRAANLRKNKTPTSEMNHDVKNDGFASGSTVILLASDFAPNKSKPAAKPTPPESNKAAPDKERRNFFEKIYEWFVGIFKQKNSKPNCSCPTLNVAAPESPVRPGGTMTFTAQVSGGSPNSYNYNWSVSSGTITGGQGTTSITVGTEGVADGTFITATVNISEIECANCPASASAQGRVAARAAPGGGWSIQGRITDSNNVPVMQATVTVTDAATGEVVGDAETDGNGIYRVLRLNSGVYRVKASAANLRSVETQIEVGVGLNSTVSLTLPPGVSQSPTPISSPPPSPSPNTNANTIATNTISGANTIFNFNANVNTNPNINTNPNVNTNIGLNANVNFNANSNLLNASANAANNSNAVVNINSGAKQTGDKIEYSYPARLVKDTRQKIFLNLQPMKPDDVTSVTTSANFQTNGVVVFDTPVPQEAGYTTYVTVTLIADDGLEILSANAIQQKYTRSHAAEDLTKWEWDVKLIEGSEKKETIKIKFELDVELKKTGVKSKTINDFWVSEEFEITVGLLLFQALGGLLVAGGGLASAAGVAQGKLTAADEVQCTLYAPAKVAAGNDFLVQVFAHLATQAAGLNAIAAASDEEAKQQAVETLDKLIERGSRLTFELRLPEEFTIDEPIQSQKWNGRIVEMPFIVRVPPNYASSSRFGKVIVSENDVPIGRLTFKLQIVGAAAQPTDIKQSNEPVAELEHYRRVFISYSSKDRVKVESRVQAWEAAHIECYMDVLSLKPGENWADKLYEFIDRSDAFFLFWSSAARDSNEVKKEILYALERQRKTGDESPDIIPIIIEGPPIITPPNELNKLHFNDRHVYFGAAFEAESEQRKRAD